MNRQNRIAASLVWGAFAFAAGTVISLVAFARCESSQTSDGEGDERVYLKRSESMRGLVLGATVVLGFLGGACGALWRYTQPQE